MNWIVCTSNDFDLYTDHKNLVIYFISFLWLQASFRPLHGNSYDGPLTRVSTGRHAIILKVLKTLGQTFWPGDLSHILLYDALYTFSRFNFHVFLISNGPCKGNSWNFRTKIYVPQGEVHFSWNLWDKFRRHHLATGRCSLHAVWLWIIANTSPAEHCGLGATERVLGSKIKQSTLLEVPGPFVHACITFLSKVREKRATFI